MIKDWDNRSYAAKVGDAISQLINALAGGAPDESLSGRSFRVVTLEPSPPWRWRAVRWTADRIFFWQEGHSEQAFWEDAERSRARGLALPGITAAIVNS